MKYKCTLCAFASVLLFFFQPYQSPSNHSPVVAGPAAPATVSWK